MKLRKINELLGDTVESLTESFPASSPGEVAIRKLIRAVQTKTRLRFMYRSGKIVTLSGAVVATLAATEDGRFNIEVIEYDTNYRYGYKPRGKKTYKELSKEAAVKVLAKALEAHPGV